MKRRKFSLVLSFILSAVTGYGQLVFHTDFNETSGSNTATDSISGESFAIHNLFDRPERIEAPHGSALRLDGWSTYISSPSFTIEGIDRQLSIEAWYATESFTKESSAIIELTADNSGFYLSVGPFGELNFGYHLDNRFFVHNTPKKLTPYQWHHIVATIDLDAGETKIVVDNELWFISSGLDAKAISIPTSDLYIGKRSITQTVAGFSTNTLNGAIDDIKVYAGVLSEAEIAAHYAEVPDKEADLYIDPDVRHANDHLRPQYHPMPNTSWTNEPYGLIYYEGNYHLFFQKNPNGPYLHFMHWGHLISPDLVHWTEQDIALRPSPGFDNFGVWSGTTIKDQEGKPVIFYTGVDGIKAGIGSAFFEDDSLIRWHENENNPMIPHPPSGFNHLDFRDPYIWKDNETYYMIVGSGLQDQRGGILFTYRSADLENWTLIPRLYTNDDIATFGEFWEMPSFVHLEGAVYLLQLTPTPRNGKPARSIYLIGEWKNETFTPFSHVPQSMELFDSHMLAPAFGVDEKTRNTYIGIIPEDRNVDDQIAAGWRQTFSIPRQFRYLEDSAIGQIPHPNLCRLRSDEKTISNLVLENGKRDNLPDFGGNQIELEFDIKADSNASFVIQVLKHADEQEYTTITFDYGINKIVLDRRMSTLSASKKDTRIGDFVFDPADTLNVRIFIDHSTLEVFVHNLTVFSARVYPSRAESDKVDAVSIEGNVEVIKASQWQMASMLGHEVIDISCTPDHLPDSYNKLPEDKKKEVLGNIGTTGEGIAIYPNPAASFLNVKTNGSGTYTLISLSGKNICGGAVKGRITRLNLRGIPEGMYVLKIQTSKTQYAKKIMIKN